MNCTATSHLWIWTGDGCLNETPPHLRCQCRRYMYEEYHSQAEQNARLRERVAALEGAGNEMFAHIAMESQKLKNNGWHRCAERLNGSADAWRSVMDGMAGQEAAP